MSDLFWLTDAQMARLERFFPKSHGKPRVDDRRICHRIDNQLPLGRAHHVGRKQRPDGGEGLVQCREAVGGDRFGGDTVKLHPALVAGQAGGDGTADALAAIDSMLLVLALKNARNAADADRTAKPRT